MNNCLILDGINFNCSIRSANMLRIFSLFGTCDISSSISYERIPISASVLSRAFIVRRKQFVVFQSEKGGLIFRTVRDLHYISKPEAVDQEGLRHEAR